MPIMIVCGGCKRKLRIPDALLGKIVKCPHCARKSRMPTQPKKKASIDKAETKTVAKSTTVALKKPAVEKNGVVDKKKTPSATEKNGSADKKKTPAAPKPAPPENVRKSAPPPKPMKIEAPPDRSAEETVDDLAEAPPPPKPPVKPTPAPPPRAPQRSVSAPVAVSMLVVLGGAFIGIFVVGAAIAYLFYGDAAVGDVSGAVTLDGQPLEGAYITFVGTDPKLGGPYSATSDANGKYKIPAGIPPGKYKICVEKSAMLDGKTAVGNIDELKEQGLLRNVVPDQYQKHQDTTLSIEVKAGRNDVPIKLDSATAK